MIFAVLDVATLASAHSFSPDPFLRADKMQKQKLVEVLQNHLLTEAVHLLA